MGLAGGGHGVHRAPVEGVERGDDLEGAVLVQLAVAAGQLERALHGLGAAVAEEHPVHARVVDEHGGDVQLGQGVELVRRLDQGRRLLGDGVDHHRRAVSQVVHGPAGHEVDVLLAVGVPHSRALAPHDDHRPSAHGLGIVLLLDGNVFSVAGHDKSAPCECVGRRRHTWRRRGHYTPPPAPGLSLRAQRGNPVAGATTLQTARSPRRHAHLSGKVHSPFIRAVFENRQNQDLRDFMI